MRVSFLLSIIVLVATAVFGRAQTSPAELSPDLPAALALFKAHRYPDAHAAFEKILARDPANATACHYLGRVLLARNDKAALEEGLRWLARAVELAPDNATFLGLYGGAALQQAGRTNSYSTATKGRDALEKTLTLDPANLDAREGLFQFYQRAPWPLGSAAKAAAQLDAIRQRDPDRAIALEVLTKASAKDFPAAFQLCEAALAKNPDNYAALYQLGRTASISGLQLERGLACLRRCLALPPPTPSSPTPSHVWQRIGHIHEKLRQPAEARLAYETALQLDSGNRQAADALARLRP